MNIIEERIKICWLGPGVDGIFAEIHLADDSFSKEDVFIVADDSVDERHYSVSNVSFFDEDSEYDAYESYALSDQTIKESEYYKYFLIADRLLDQFEKDSDY